MINTLRHWWRQRQAAGLQIAPELWGEVEAGLPFLAHLSLAEREQLRQLAREFIASKEWSGAAGLSLTPRMQLQIALQACLLVLHRGLACYDGWLGIVVYPGDFVIPRQVLDEDGVMHEYDDPVMGEAWHGGPVLLSWFDQAEDADGINVVIHEFAHKLDMQNGDADGLPPLPAGMSVAEWVTVMEQAFDDFQRRVDAGEDTAIDPYAAEWPAEFFAVVSEAFFQTPQVLQHDYPQVYGQLQRFYQQSPAAADRSAA